MGNGQEKPKLLIVDDDREFCKRLKEWGAQWFTISAAYDPTEAMTRLKNTAFNLVLLDLGLPGHVSGFEFLKILKVRSIPVPVIMLTGNSQHRTVVACMSAGASDYVIKGTEGFLDELQFRINQVLQKHRLENRALKIATNMTEELNKHQIVGESDEILILKSVIARQLGSPSTVLITGESGTGKELVARALHRQEQDALIRKFVAFNCGALQEDLVESELFGHKKGSYTGATEDFKGKFLAADGGDLFLDEVGELSQNIQKKLLRVIQERIVTPVGSTENIPVNVRIIAATNRNLEHEVARGNFREDLFYRLNVIRINVPPLRKRVDEIPVLAKYFATKFLPGSKISDEAMDFLTTQVWLGNVRELEHCLESACNRVRGDTRRIIEKADVEAHSFVSKGRSEDSLPSWLLPKNINQVNPEHFQEAMDWLERSYLERALMLHGESRTLVAERLNVSRSHVQRKLKKLGFIEGRDVDGETS